MNLSAAAGSPFSYCITIFPGMYPFGSLQSMYGISFFVTFTFLNGPSGYSIVVIVFTSSFIICLIVS